MSHGGGTRKVVVVLVVIAIIGFIAFLVALLVSGREPRGRTGGGTEPPAAAREERDTRATSTRPGLAERFFKLLGYDFSVWRNRPAPPPPPPLAPLPTPPAAITNPPTSSIDPASIPEGFVANDLSPYYGRIRISYVSHPNLDPIEAYRNSYSELTLAVDLPAGERATITGWTVRAREGSFVIPSGNEYLSPYAVRNEDPIMVRSGDTVRILSRSALQGTNFRLNACTGYLTGYAPELPQWCPLLYRTRTELSSYSGECQDYVLSLPRCAAPASQPPIRSNDSQCFALLARANYAGCYSDHRADADFLAREWRVWLGTPSNPQRNIFDPRHDRVLIFDLTGELVAQYLY